MILYGHRGAKGEAPENTLSGFVYARRLGVEAFELDLHLSADDELVVIHDATVDRTTNGAGPVSAYTAAALARLDARAAFPDWPEPCGVPTLGAVLDEAGDTPRFEIEIKTDDPARLAHLCALLVPILEDYGLRDPDRVTVSSFDPVAVEQIGRVAPDLPRGFIGAYNNRSFLETALRLGCAQADIPLATGSAEMVRQAHAHGLRVTGWLGNTVDDVERLLAWEVDHITTDYPRRALTFLCQSETF